MLEGVYFFAKNIRGEIMLVSQSILTHYDMADELEMLGKTDFDLTPGAMAQGYVFRRCASTRPVSRSSITSTLVR